MSINDRIYFTSNIALGLKDYLNVNSFSSVVVLCDKNTREHCYPLIENIIDFGCITIEAGENHKNLDTCVHIWEKMTSLKMDRKSLLINLGGGVIGDIGAFCAATFKRGVSFVQIPTTLLAMTDAAMGSKAGVNFGIYKNHIGLFTDPKAIFIDNIFLNTLPDRHILNGFAETIKHAIIADKKLWEQIQVFDAKDISSFNDIIKLSAQVKITIVDQDPFESGLRKILNFGHTIGHLIESFYLKVQNENAIFHGEAVAQGMVIESILSHNIGLLNSADLKQIRDLISRYFKISALTSELKTYILDHAYQDKKNTYGQLLFALPEKIGQSKFDVMVSQEELGKTLNNYQNY